MKKLILILLFLFVSLPQISFGGKGKKEVSKVKVFMSNRELTKDEMTNRNWIEVCKNISNDIEVIDRIEITDNTNSWFKIEIVKGYNVVLGNEDYFNVTELPKNKIVLNVYPWILSGDELEGDYLVRIYKQSNSDHLLKLSGEEPDNEPEEIVDFLLHFRECGD